MEFQYQTIFCIVNSGYSEQVMDAAKKLGARGGTILNARGTANKNAETFFGITIQPEKEIVMIVVPTAIKDSLLHALYKEVGLDTPGQGIAFALPVDSVVGLSEEPETK
ncbi:MAG: P-II family nitrogen regulator [Clostridia bacterium]|nr:P-II family nitrogen regulator [Clostridia bacterium]